MELVDDRRMRMRPVVPVGPTSLDDLKPGALIDGDSGSSSTVPPPWLDPARYERGRAFFERQYVVALCSIFVYQFGIGS